MKKQNYFTVIKIGYSVGVYGCSNEYFNCIYTTKEGLKSFCFKGLYGAEDRIEEAIKNKGYKFNYISNQFGLIKGEAKNWVGFKYENEAIDIIKNL
jgi:hypothetical protein